MSDRYPWDNTSNEISGELPAQFATPLESQQYADKAREAAEKVADDALQNHRQTGGNEHPVATQLLSGFMSGPDKTKLDTVQSGAETNQNAYSSVNGIMATSKSDSFQIAGMTGIAVTEDIANKKINITATGTSTPGPHGVTHLPTGPDAIPYANTTTGGLMSPESFNNITTLQGNVTSLTAADTTINNRIDTTNAGVSALTTRVNQLTYNVRDYGAIGDGVADDTQAFKDAVADVITKGGTIFIPAGRYLIKDQINIDISGYPDTQKAVNIKGDNPNTTFLINNTAGKYVFQITGVHFTYFYMGHLSIEGTDINTDRGIHMIYLSEQYIENVVFHNLFLGTQMEDVVRCKFVSCTWDQNRNGLYGNDQISESTPNAIDFFGCIFYGNAEAGLFINKGCNINFFGGTIETNGHMTSVANRWGARFQDLGRYGGGGASFFGTYFEGNANVADVWINESLYPSTYNFTGCTFNKFAAPKNNDHNIRVDIGSFAGPNGYPVKLVVTACAFRDYGNTPSASTPYIKFYSGGAPVVFEQSGNYYQSQVELPQASSNRVFANGRLINLSATPAVWRAFNVAAVSKISTGVYKIDYIFPAVSNRNITTISTDILGYTRVSNESETSMRIEVFNSAGNPTDPGQITFITCE